MTVEAGQTSTKISIVNNKLNNDNSKQADTNGARLLADQEPVTGAEADIAYIASVPIFLRSGEHQWNRVDQSSVALKRIQVTLKHPNPCSGRILLLLSATLPLKILLCGRIATSSPSLLTIASAAPSSSEKSLCNNNRATSCTGIPPPTRLIPHLPLQRHKQLHTPRPILRR